MDTPPEITPPKSGMRCQRCGSALAIAEREVGAKVTCAGCGASFTIMPKPLPVDSLLAEELLAPEPLRAAPVDDVAARLRARDAQQSLREGDRFVRREPPPVPKWTFFSGVFTFPCYPSTAGAWAGISFGVTLTLILAQSMVLLFSAGGSATIVVAGSAFMGLVWTFMLASSFTAAYCRIVVEETAAGADSIGERPSINPREWIADLWLPGAVGALSILAGGAVVYFLDLSDWAAGAVVAMLVFPLFMLSALESGSALLPYSPLVWRSLLNLCWAWLTFYALTLAIGLAFGKAIEAIYKPSPWIGVLVAGPSLSALVLIYTRLLGRLAWRIERWVEKRQEREGAEAE